jgi:hypothetical protein
VLGASLCVLCAEPMKTPVGLGTPLVMGILASASASDAMERKSSFYSFSLSKGLPNGISIIPADP